MRDVIQGNERTDTCLRCPRGCDIRTALGEDGAILSVQGNRCRMGDEYVRQEIAAPRRILPTSVRVRHGVAPLAPVWTPEPIPKALLLDLAAASRDVVLEAPVHVGDIALSNWRGLGIDLVVSGEVPRAQSTL